MEKLLHERLREHEDGHNFVLSDGFRAVITQKAACRLADEIERHYAPYLRDENGEPVSFGTEIEWADFTTRKMTGFGVMPNGQPYVSCWNDGLGMDDVMLPIRGYLKRPTPKVYDADGVECKEYEWVWDEAGNEWEILPRPADAEEGKVWAHNPDGVHKYLDASNLTHREPDSLKRLLNDIREYLATSPVIDSHAREWEKRFAALIERCA